jgi:hypothetical protein
MFVSKKLPGIRLVPIELEVGRQTPSECTQPLQDFVATGLAGHFQFTSIGDADLDIITPPSFQCFNDGGGKTNRKAVAPFRDLHDGLHGYTVDLMYIQARSR